MEYQEKKLQLFKLAAMATLKEKSPARFSGTRKRRDEILYSVYQP